MSDTPDTNATPSPDTVITDAPAPAQPAGQPAAPAPSPAPEPVAQPQIDPDVVRNAAAYKGARPLIDQLVQAGIKTVDDLNPYLQLSQVATERNLDVSQLISVLQGKQPAANPASPTGQEQQFLTKDDLVSTLEARDAMAQFQADLTAMDSSLSAMRQEVAQATGLDANNEALNLIIDSLQNQVLDSNLYPEQHPLHTTKLKPLDASQIAKIKEQAIGLATKFRGQQAVTNAQQALNSIPAQPSGSGLESKPGEGVSSLFNPHANRAKSAVSDAEAILANAFGRTQPGVVANSV